MRSQRSLSELLSKAAKGREGQQWPVLSAGASPGWQVCPGHMAPTLNLALGKNVAIRFCCQQICWCSCGFQEGKQMVSWIGQEEFNSLGSDGVWALRTMCCQVAAPLLSYSLSQGSSSDLAAKETKNRQGQKGEAQAPAELFVLRSRDESFPQRLRQILGHSSLGDQVSSGALHLCLWERQQGNTWEVVRIFLDNFSGVYCHVKMSPRTQPKTSSDGHPLHGETPAIFGHWWHGFK